MINDKVKDEKKYEQVLCRVTVSHFSQGQQFFHDIFTQKKWNEVNTGNVDDKHFFLSHV